MYMCARAIGFTSVSTIGHTIFSTILNICRWTLSNKQAIMWVLPNAKGLQCMLLLQCHQINLNVS
jgi:hypothetical protein